MADGNNAALRANQALLHIGAPLGRFFWEHLATGEEAWLQGLELQRVNFMSIALALSSESTSTSLNQSSADPRSRLFTCLALDPGSTEIRVSLARSDPHDITISSRQWLSRIHGVHDHEDFLVGLLHLLSASAGASEDLNITAERWNALAHDIDLAPGLRALRALEEVPEGTWERLATRAEPPLATALETGQPSESGTDGSGSKRIHWVGTGYWHGWERTLGTF